MLIVQLFYQAGQEIVISGQKDNRTESLGGITIDYRPLIVSRWGTEAVKRGRL